ncbi:MAG: transporter substrate-binding protein [Cryobacterium sp.]|nr:transporter substrate-binding protein [Cryobacterium sp.]
MSLQKKSRLAVVALGAAAALALSGCTAGGDGGDGAAPETLVIDRTFDLKTADPGRTYEHTGNMVVKAMYETLLDFEGSDLSRTVPGLASLEASEDSTTFTLTLEDGRTFSDGSEITADDVVFSIERVIGMKGSPSFLLDGVSVTKVDDSTVEFTTETPNPALPFILPNPALAILNSDVVKENGGTTDETDDAETYLNANSAGSGPYVLDSLDVASQVTFSLNEEYTGPAKPTFERVILRNVESSTQKINIEGGDSHLALDLSGDQVADFGDKVNVVSGPSANMIFLLLNQDPKISAITSDPNFVQAVKLGIDYESLLEIAGEGAAQAFGLVPPMFLGSLTEGLTYDAAAAKAALAKSNYNGEKVTLNFPNDINLNGVQFTTVAQRVQSELAEIGITVELAPAPTAVELDTYRNGQETIGLWYWGPDYMDPSSYLPFGPGETVGLRAGWPAGSHPELEALVAEARLGGTEEERIAQFTEFQERMLAEGPFVPLLNPAINMASAKGITGLDYNPMWTVDIAAIGAE